ncbi:respiratory nitrite reductase (cytochrome ammonia-forming) precursor [Geoalkalibacter ferrihydriticus]|uniref:nitrite reductase (cytochrome; ammonia-forming) n=2 Tax=Geoalkalibacter ferrihydriticus TaxID=392333 RepID=A0A0C2HTF9_9BACT|nr:ammonia-forming cytochrome c nitrite reductase subunit c552 [Geoalkalibacter ferrihydriticus]KIH78095.1 cytochrome C nitrite reductase [Geoalkalibacter ferrihydriticus DSM 17813]SDM78054.1 respiratory nitrite reductase (cytochrome ammonia-forming) precursor [Geoalkalibacter ferrihydriticus]
MKKFIALSVALLLSSGSLSLLQAADLDLGEGNLRFKNLPQYQTYLKNNDDSQMTEYGGSVPHRKHDGVNPLPKGYKHAQPYLKNLWLGYPFSYEYDRARGHTYALDDVFKIDRINRYSEQAGLPATCLNCKTNTIPDLLEKHGDDFWASEFHQYREVHDGKMHSIGCTNCHDPDQAMRLAITSVPLDEALKRQGKDWREASRQEMRSLVCAQCHVEYYFETKDYGVAAKPHFPWDKGMNPDDIYAFFAAGDPERDGFKGQFVDWTHAVSKTPMIKTQHPEYEMYHDSVHGAAGVSCADCHMPRVKVGPATISSHHWTSPLKSDEMIRSSCMGCHGDKSPEFLKSRVVYHQEKTWNQLMVAQEKSVRAHEAVRQAMEFEGVDKDVLAEAREMVRKGQWFWDYVSAENSAGFHNPTKALETLALSQQYSDEAVRLATRSTNYAIAASLDKPIQDLVPPIMEHSRKLQQSQEHLDSHFWLQYLPKLPEAELIWDGYGRVR